MNEQRHWLDGISVKYALLMMMMMMKII